MKTKFLSFSAIALSVFFLGACQRDAQDQLVPASNRQGISTEAAGGGLTSRGRAVCNTDVYDVVLESRTFVNGNWEWVWSFQNSNPGDGTNGTAQDLSHWGMPFATCFPLSAIVGAAYSANGTSWHTFTPVIQADPSLSCLGIPVLKFDFGTTGANKSYYRITLSQDIPTAWASAYAKSGSNCCLFNFDGIGCPGGVPTNE